MSALTSLKSMCLKKSFKSFKNLEIGEYIVDKFSKVETDLGSRIRIDIGDIYMFLPERFASLDEEALAELNLKPKIMVYSGKDPETQNRLILDFQDAEFYADLLQGI